jgi:hypothetical protein
MTALNRCLLSILIATVLPATATAAASTLADMKVRAQASLKLDRTYDQRAGQALFGDRRFVDACAPRSLPPPDAFTMYIEILTDGRIGETLYAPMNATGRCIQDRIKGFVFPKPPAPYVLEINLKFMP